MSVQPCPLPGRPGRGQGAALRPGPIMAASSLVLKCQGTRNGVPAEMQTLPGDTTVLLEHLLQVLFIYTYMSDLGKGKSGKSYGVDGLNHAGLDH